MEVNVRAKRPFRIRDRLEGALHLVPEVNNTWLKSEGDIGLAREPS
jgi:hypothetical protein